MSLPTLLREAEPTMPGWQRKVRDLVNLVARRTIDQGETAARPVNADVGTQYYDKTLSIPVWFDGADWRDASGAVV